MRIFFASIIKKFLILSHWVGYNVFALFPRPHRGDLYKCAGPTMRHLQKLKKKKMTNAQQMPGGMPAVGIDWGITLIAQSPIAAVDVRPDHSIITKMTLGTSELKTLFDT